MLRKNVDEMIFIARTECNYLLNLVNSLKKDIHNNKMISKHYHKLISARTKKIENLYENYNQELDKIDSSLDKAEYQTDIHNLELCLSYLRSQFKDAQINFIQTLIQMNRDFKPPIEKLYYVILPKLAIDQSNGYDKILDEYRESLIKEIQRQFSFEKVNCDDIIEKLYNYILPESAVGTSNGDNKKIDDFRDNMSNEIHRLFSLGQINYNDLIEIDTAKKRYYNERNDMKLMIVLTFLKMNCKFFSTAFQLPEFDDWCEKNSETGVKRLSENILCCFPSQDILAEFSASLLQYNHTGNEDRLRRYFYHPAYTNEQCESRSKNLILCLYSILMGYNLIDIENIINTWKQDFKNIDIKNVQPASQYFHSIWYKSDQEDVMINDIQSASTFNGVR